ncbi:hypothetical protein BJP34_02870 [Moorena producens PAL-8-15-08-1]|uniref:Uncharacterized protein n=1 Tax=Moorena producens PAL-8-15-08-1 TaxID=1458985 RepID=A0A1D8TM73_9CYAN|nr:hypothetical protein [Moorena producens]AOW98525.1 hypothetical protein BJP34_02870 [Moorena producens PAL-8-15-08-1]
MHQGLKLSIFPGVAIHSTPIAGAFLVVLILLHRCVSVAALREYRVFVKFIKKPTLERVWGDGQMGRWRRFL